MFFFGEEGGGGGGKRKEKKVCGVGSKEAGMRDNLMDSLLIFILFYFFGCLSCMIVVIG